MLRALTMEYSSTAGSVHAVASAPVVLTDSSTDGEDGVVTSTRPSILIMHYNDYETHVVISRGDDSSRGSLRAGHGLCRICHSTDKIQKLVAPCHCKGSMLYVHKACLERWLETRASDNCELCHFQYRTVKTPMRFREWLGSNSGSLRKRLIEDSIFTLALTAVTLCVAASVFVALSHLDLTRGDGDPSPWWQRVLQTFLSGDLTLLMAVYFYWTVRTIRHHYLMFQTWRATHFHVKLVLQPSISQGSLQLADPEVQQVKEGVEEDTSLASITIRSPGFAIHPLTSLITYQQSLTNNNNVETMV